MKKILITTIVASALAVSAFAQGTVSFANTASTLIRYTTDGTTLTTVPTGNPAQVSTYGNLNIALYSAATGTAISLVGGIPDLSGWTIQSSALLRQITPIAGRVPATTVTLSGVAEGAPAQVIVVGWTGSFANFGLAATDGTGLIGWAGSTLSTGALGWTQGTGAPNGIPPTAAVPIVSGTGGFNGLVLAPVPEPATFAMLGLGAAALLVFRRRS